MATVAAMLPATASCGSLVSGVRVPDYRFDGDEDDTPAVTRALKTGQGVYFPAGQGSAKDGAYLLRAVSLPSRAQIWGDGGRSVLRAAPDVMNVFVAATAAPNQVLDNIGLRDLRIEGPVEQTGFREHWNLVSLSGVRNVKIERVQFVGFAGDGLYLGAEQEGPTREPRVIQGIMISECQFDGVNNDNRNGISVTGGTGITIDRCHFRRCTRANMPGPIDFEPDTFAFYGLRQLRVTNCDFEECGGNVGQVAIVVPAVVSPPRDVTISGNIFRSYRGTGGDIAITINRQPNAATPAMDFEIENNVGIGGYSGIQIFSGKGITIRNNSWTGYASRSLLGFFQSGAGVLDVSVSKNRFEGCGWREGIAFAIYKADNVRIEGNQFIGTGNGGPGSAPLYIGKGRVRGLRLLRNDWRGNPKARGLVIIERGADYLPGTGQIEGNLLPDSLALPDL